MNKIIENIEISILKIIVDTLGQLSNGIKLASKEGFTSGKMLDYIYKNEPSGQLIIGKIIDKIYLNHPGWQDVRKRKDNLVLNLKEAVDLTLKAKGEARICDVASGPARYILDVLEQFKEQNVSAELRDLDTRWLLEANEAAKSRGVQIEYKTANALEESDFIFDIPVFHQCMFYLPKYPLNVLYCFLKYPHPAQLNPPVFRLQCFLLSAHQNWHMLRLW